MSNFCTTDIITIQKLNHCTAMYYLIESWMREHGNEDDLLPGLNYTRNQMFWISAANTWCIKTSKEVKITVTCVQEKVANKFYSELVCVCTH